MTISLNKIFNNPLVNGCGLFLLFSLPICLMVVLTMLETDLSGGEGISEMIGYSVRWAVPFIYLVVAASSFHILFPSEFSKWWLRNRKYIGLSFAVAMAWQGLFIFIVSTTYREYYFSEIYVLRDELEGTVGYIFLVAMVVTSFQFARRHFDLKQWKLIQKGGVYFLWAYPFSVYWWNLFYYPTLEGAGPPRMLDYIFYWTGFIAFSLRIAAWGKQRYLLAIKTNVAVQLSMVHKMIGEVGYLIEVH